MLIFLRYIRSTSVAMILNSQQACTGRERIYISQRGNLLLQRAECCDQAFSLLEFYGKMVVASSISTISILGWTSGRPCIEIK